MPKRQLTIDRNHLGKTVGQLLKSEWGLDSRTLAGRQVQLDGKAARLNWRVRRGQTLAIVSPQGASLPRAVRMIEIVHFDEHLLVVNKPAGMTTVRHADEIKSRERKFLPQTLVDWLPKVLVHKGLIPQTPGRPPRVRAVHRLDKETSGLMVLARTPEAESELGRMFRMRGTERKYLALVRGKAEDARIESNFVEDRGDGRRGSAEDGQRAVTHVLLLEALGNFSFVECRLETGRTHQVRIHLGEAGTPLCGETIYDRPIHGRPFRDGSEAQRPMLHAAALGFDHPVTGERMSFDAPPPEDFEELLARMRKKAK